MDNSYNATSNPIGDAIVVNNKEESKQYIPDDKVYKLVKEKNKLKFSWIVLIYGWKYKALFLSVVFVVTFSAFLVSLNTLFLRNVLSAAQASDGRYWNLSWQWWMAVTATDLILLYFCTYIRNSCSIMLAVNIEVELRNLTIKRLLEQDISYYSDKKIGKLMTKLVGDTNVIGNEISGMIAWVIQAPLVIVMGTAMMFAIHWQLALVASICVYSLTFLVILFSLQYQKKVKKVRDVISDVNGDVIDRIGAIKLVKATGTRRYEESRLEELHKPYIKAFKPISKIDGTLLAILIASDVLINLIMITIAIEFFNDNKMLTTTLPSFISAMVGLTRPLWQIAAIIPGLSRAAASSAQIYEVIEKDPILDDKDKTGILFDENISKIEFRQVKFNYPEKPEVNIVPNLDITLEKGKSYAFVGETGSGKSTISKLLLRFYDPTEGCVLVNDKNLSDFNLKSYLSHVGYVEQEPSIIFGDVYDNVRYGHFGATEEEVHEACKKAQIDQIINSWPYGYQTILGERGLLLSGGQKQRLVIARILLRNPELLILDEATSALDNIVEKEIQAQLNELMKDKTSVIIAHRLSTIKDVDKIFVLAPGKGIVQEGTYKELIKIPGKFKDLHDAGKS
ncbi:ABC transporter ATP-binding protein [Spiroplasma cantharicola]|uniref:ATP-binding cassette, subfamily B, bacterial MsbA n=1 Tax=Spiroplasma cantharicola TaxID=362837 RepID=A0A0M4K123_9MOLU|nr:ABC transporter ATP-binding protein [Spiroplasma cantharicola]ALD66237.1 ATP-binding cassette, subfamily B, bacterial MsbA [Spiroplasma cantharicola]